MNTTEIRQVMNSMSPEMINAFQERVLGGVTLESVCEEYESVKGNPYCTLAKWMNYNIGYILVLGIICFLIMLHGYVMIFFTVLFIMIASEHLWSIKEKRLKKECEILSECQKKFTAFEDAVSALNPLGITIRAHSEASVRDMLVTLAVRILDCEASFDEVRKQDWRDVFGILHLGNFLQSCLDDFEKVSRCAKQKFGIEFKKDGLFVDAQKHIVRQRIKKSKLS